MTAIRSAQWSDGCKSMGDEKDGQSELPLHSHQDRLGLAGVVLMLWQVLGEIGRVAWQIGFDLFRQAVVDSVDDRLFIEAVIEGPPDGLIRELRLAEVERQGLNEGRWNPGDYAIGQALSLAEMVRRDALDADVVDIPSFELCKQHGEIRDVLEDDALQIGPPC